MTVTCVVVLLLHCCGMAVPGARAEMKCNEG